MAKMCEEIFSSVYTGEMSIDDERVVALLTDAFKVREGREEKEGTYFLYGRITDKFIR